MKRLTTYLVACLWCWATLIPLHAQGLRSFLSGSVAATGTAIAYVTAAKTSFSITTGPTINYPTAVANDIWLAIVATDSSHNSTGTPPSGWTELDEFDGSDSSTSIFWKRATGSEGATQTWTSLFDNNELGAVIILVYRNCKTTGSPINVQGTPTESTSTASQSCPAVTTTVNNCMVVGIVTTDPNSDQTFEWSAPTTERIDVDTTPNGLRTAEAAIYVGDQIKSTAGAVTLSGSLSAVDIGLRFAYALEPQ